MAKDQTKRYEMLETIREYEPYRLCGPLDALIADLSAANDYAVQKGWYGVHVNVDQNYEDVMIYVKAWRNETDAEYDKRMDYQRSQLEKKKRRQERAAINAAKKLQKTEEEERAVYEQLKRKFG